MELKNLEQYSILYSTVHETLKSDLIVRHTLHLAEFNPKLSIETKMREPARAAGRGPREQWTALHPLQLAKYQLSLNYTLIVINV